MARCLLFVVVAGAVHKQIKHANKTNTNKSEVNTQLKQRTQAKNNTHTHTHTHAHTHTHTHSKIRTSRLQQAITHKSHKSLGIPMCFRLKTSHPLGIYMTVVVVVVVFVVVVVKFSSSWHFTSFNQQGQLAQKTVIKSKHNSKRGRPYPTKNLFNSFTIKITFFL